MLARLEDRLDAAVRCPTCGWRRAVVLIEAEMWAVCPYCHDAEPAQ